MECWSPCPCTPIRMQADDVQDINTKALTEEIPILSGLLHQSFAGASLLLEAIAPTRLAGEPFRTSKKLRLTITYPPSTGRNFDEILRVIDSLQLTDNYGVATPVNWQTGEDVVVVPSIPTEEAKQRFPKGLTEVKPYLRMTPQPNQ